MGKQRGAPRRVLTPRRVVQASGAVNVTIDPIAWRTAADWDGATADSGVVHESVTNTDHDDETAVRMGYSYGSPLYASGLRAYYPLDEDSGPAAYDLSGNGFDGSETGGATPDQTGVLGTSGWSFDGTDDAIQCPTGLWDGSQSVHASVFWFKPDATGQQGIHDEFDNWTVFYDRNGSQGINVASYGDNATFGSGLAIGAWHFVYAHWEPGSEYGASINGGPISTVSTTDGLESTANPQYLGSADAGSSLAAHLTGQIAYLRFHDTKLTNSEVQTLYDIATAESSLTTATKSFQSETEPDLQNMVYSLNGETIALDVIGSPGTGSEEVVTQVLDGDAGYTLSWSNSHADFRVRPRLSTGDVTTTATISEVELE